MQPSKGEGFAFATQLLLNGIFIAVRHGCLGPGPSWSARLVYLRHRMKHAPLSARIDARNFIDAKALQFFTFLQEEGEHLKNDGGDASDGRQKGRKGSRLEIKWSTPRKGESERGQREKKEASKRKSFGHRNTKTAHAARLAALTAMSSDGFQGSVLCV